MHRTRNHQAICTLALRLAGLLLALLLATLAAAAAGPTGLDRPRQPPFPQPDTWVAGETSISGLSPEELQRLCGIPLEQLEAELDQARRMAPLAPSARDYPPVVDWRDRDGYDWTTPIRDQQFCMSCAAFGTIGAIESRLEIGASDPDLNPDLSEAHLFFCGCGRCCGKGWLESSALAFATDPGIVDEACFPYAGYNQPCTPCSDWQERVTRLAGCHGLADDTQTKYAIATWGPVSASMTVYSDFSRYTGGIYRRTAEANAVGGHCVTLVGYNDLEGYWIAKNSWGTDWGESGWFRIAYDQKIYALYNPMIYCNDPYEINDTPTQAAVPLFGPPHRANICPVGDLDYYAFAGRGGEWVTVDVDAEAIGSGLDAELHLYAADGSTELASSLDHDGRDPAIDFLVPADGRYTLLMRRQDQGVRQAEADADYQISLQVDPWRVEVPGLGSPGITNRSLVIDELGQPHMALNLNRLYHGWREGSSWHLETVDGTYGTGTYASLALEAGGRLHVSYFDPGTGSIRYAQQDHGGWYIQTVDYAGDTGGYTSLALDGQGRPHISYYSSAGDELKYAYYDGAVWRVEVVDSQAGAGKYSSLALDAAGRAHLSYLDGSGEHLNYALRDGGEWSIEVVDAAWAGQTALAVDAFGQPHLVYQVWTRYRYWKYAYKGVQGWQMQSIDSTDDIGWEPSIVLDRHDQPHLGYGWWAEGTGGPKYAFSSSGIWRIETLDTMQESRLWWSTVALALDRFGYPHLVYTDPSDSTLRYATLAHGLAIQPPASTHTALPGDRVTYKLQITNTGAVSDTFDLAITGTVWPMTAPQSAGPLPARGGMALDVVVTIPASVQGPASNTATVTLTSRVDSTQSVSVTLTTTVPLVHGLDLAPTTAAGEALPGDVVSYTLHLTNTGTVSDTFDLAITGNIWPTAAPALVGPLFPRSSTEFAVAVTAPITTVASATDAVTLTATSRGNHDRSASATLTTSVPVVHSLDLAPTTAAGQALPGGAISYTLHLTNTGTVSDSFDLSLAGNAWSAHTAAAVGPLLPRSATPFGVAVTVPITAVARAMDTVTVTATSRGDPDRSASATLTTSVPVVHGLALAPTAAEGSAFPGGPVSYTLHLTNTGTVSDTFELAIGGHTWPTSAPSPIGPLAPRAGTTLTVRVQIPKGAASGETDTATLYVTSLGDGGQEATARLTTTARGWQVYLPLVVKASGG